MKQVSDHPDYQWHEPGPDAAACALSVAKAIALRRERHRQDPRYSGVAEATLAAAVMGISVPPRRGPDEWWLVGRVRDELEDADYSVWYLPPGRRIGLSRQERDGG